MRKKVLTRADIEAAKPTDSEYRLWDAKVPGLCLRVWPSGVKAFAVTWKRNSRRSLGTYPGLTLEAARTRALAVLNDAAANGEPEIAQRRVQVSTLREYVDRVYRPWAVQNLKRGEMAADRIEQVYAELLDLPLNRIDGRVVEEIRTRRLADGRSRSTCNRDLAELKSALTRAVEWNYIAEHPLDDVKLAKLDANGVVRFLSKDEEKRLRKALKLRDDRAREGRDSNNRWRAARGKDLLPVIPAGAYSDHMTPLVLMAMNTGLRRGELTNLLWSDVDLEEKIVTVRAVNAKSGTTRHVPLNRELVDVLTHWRDQQDADAKRVFAVDDPKKAWASLLDLAEVENFRFHDLRHHFASRLVMAGVDLNTVRELLGHADIKMTLRYAHLSPGHKATAVEALGQHGKRLPSAAARATEVVAHHDLAAMVDQIGDERQLRELLAQLAAKLVTT